MAWVLVVLFGLIAGMFLLNEIDKTRKYNQFLELNEKTQNSIILDKLSNLTVGLGLNDTISIGKIKELLNLLSEDVTEINTCKILIPLNEGIMKINRYNSKVEIVTSLPSKEEQLIQLLKDIEQHEVEEQIFRITKADYYLWTMVKLENGFLITTRYRK